MKDRIHMVADLLMGAAHSDGRLEGMEKATVKRMLALLEPVSILGLGLVIAAIMMSILVAILSVNELAF